MHEKRIPPVAFKVKVSDLSAPAFRLEGGVGGQTSKREKKGAIPDDRIPFVGCGCWGIGPSALPFLSRLPLWERESREGFVCVWVCSERRGHRGDKSAVLFRKGALRALSLQDLSLEVLEQWKRRR